MAAAAFGRSHRILPAALSLAAVSWTAALLFVAFTPAERVPAFAGAAVYAAGGVVCHQQPDRSFHTSRAQFAVCARCTGLYLAGTLGAMLGWIGRRAVPRHTRPILVAAALPTAVTVAGEWLGLSGFSNVTRAASALPLGATAGWLVVRMLRAESPSSTCAMIA